VAGDDPDVVRKMRLGTLNAGVLTSVGVAEIDKSVYALGVPMMYESYDELYYVLEKMRPRLESSLEGKGFVVLNWADGGWVHFFAQKRLATPPASTSGSPPVSIPSPSRPRRSRPRCRRGWSMHWAARRRWRSSRST